MLQFYMYNLKYINHYPKHILEQVTQLIEQKKLKSYLLSKYPKKHEISSDKALYEYVMAYKNSYFKKYALSKVAFDSKIQNSNSLGVHTFISRVQGSKLKAKNEIRIAALFKNVPLEFLDMIVVHELSHLKIKEHNKAFYNLCHHILENYAQIEFDVRLYLTYIQRDKKFY